jgi:hypothetical protein
LHRACAEGGETNDLSRAAALIEELRDVGRH